MGTPKNSLEIPFLDPENVAEQEFSRREKRPHLLSRLSKSHMTLFAIQVVFGIFNLAFFALNMAHSGSQHTRPPEQILSPAELEIQYRVEMHSTSGPSRFTGSPRPEVDESWSDLLKSTMVRISEDEMRMMNKTSIALQDGSGYIGYLESLHMLHCVKRIYQSQHTDYYTGSRYDGAFGSHHVDHCLEVLRQGIMCNADVTINTFYWDAENEVQANRTGPRKCTNWDRISDWADERRLELKDKEQFTPTLVPSGAPGSIGPVDLVV